MLWTNHCLCLPHANDNVVSHRIERSIYQFWFIRKDIRANWPFWRLNKKRLREALNLRNIGKWVWMVWKSSCKYCAVSLRSYAIWRHQKSDKCRRSVRDLKNTGMAVEKKIKWSSKLITKWLWFFYQWKVRNLVILRSLDSFSNINKRRQLLWGFLIRIWRA